MHPDHVQIGFRKQQGHPGGQKHRKRHPEHHWLKPESSGRVGLGDNKRFYSDLQPSHRNS